MGCNANKVHSARASLILICFLCSHFTDQKANQGRPDWSVELDRCLSALLPLLRPCLMSTGPSGDYSGKLRIFLSLN